MDIACDFSIRDPDANWRCLGFAAEDDLRDRLPSFGSLLLRAREAKTRAYAPYSRFRVGSAVLMDGELFTGTNVENASYGGTLCAERTAISTAVAAGFRSLQIIAVSTDAAPGTPIDQRSPCGLCRQVMSEFAGTETIVVLDGGDDESGRPCGELIAFDLLLPWRFRLER